MDNNRLDSLVKHFGVNTQVGMGVVARILVSVEAKKALVASGSLDPTQVEVKYRGTKGEEHKIARMLLMTYGVSINADDPLWKDL